MSETPEDHAAELAAWRKEAAGAFADLAAEFGIGAKTNLSVDQISAALRKRLEHARLPMHDRLGMIVEALGLVAGDTKWGDLTWNDVVGGVKALKERVEKAEAGLERFREVVEAKLPEYAPKADAPPDEVADERQRCQDELHAALGGCAWRSWAEMLTEVRTLVKVHASRDEVRNALGATPNESTLQAAQRVKAAADRPVVQLGDAGGSAFVRCDWRTNLPPGERQCLLLRGHVPPCRFDDPSELHEGATARPKDRVHTVRLNIGEAKKGAAHLGQVFRDAFEGVEFATKTDERDGLRCAASYDGVGSSLQCSRRLAHSGDHVHRFTAPTNAAPFRWPQETDDTGGPNEDRMLHAEQVIRQLVDTRTSDLASLRAELTALGKHVEDVERRAYASPTNDALTVELGHNINAPPGQIITTGERLDSLERRVSDNTDALALWQGAANRSTAKVDALHARIAKLEEREQEALERRVAALVVDPPHMRLRRPLSASSDAPVAEPLDLATLRVPGQATGVSETAVSFRPAGHALDIVTEVRVLPGYGSEERHEWVTVGPSEARLLARALTQWADEKEAKGAPSPQAYEPDSEDGS